MMTSGGGGYCDCGDPEAWKCYPNCELHMPKNTTVKDSSLIEDYVNKLPHDLQQRASQLFHFLFDYTLEILSIDKSDELPSHLKPE